MTGPARRVRRRDLRPGRQEAHRADRARKAGGGPAGRVAPPFDHIRRVIRSLPPAKADELADRTVRFLEAAAADYTTPRTSRRKR